MGEDSISVSGYNEASYKMLRLHESQRRISYVNQDLLKYYQEFYGYGYIVKKTEIENLMQEVWGKLDQANKDKVNLYRKLLDDLLDLYPVHEMKRVTNVEGEKKTNNVNKENFKKLKELLFIVHSYVNELLEQAGYSTFTMDDDDGDPYN
jgi:hypothetical protein